MVVAVTYRMWRAGDGEGSSNHRHWEAGAGWIERRACKHCGSYFYALAWHKATRYCSERCWRDTQKERQKAPRRLPRVTAVCLACGTQLPGTARADAKTCSATCRQRRRRAQAAPQGRAYAAELEGT